jgi:hypothetical protein
MALSWPAQGAQEFLAAEQAFELEAVGLEAGHARLQWRIAPGYYLYRKRFAVSALPSGQPLQPALPPGQRKDDPNFGVMEVYHGSVAMQLDAAGAEALRVTWQGCAEAGLCYPPQTRTVQLAAATPAAPEPKPAQSVQATSTWSLDSDGDIAQLLRERSLAWTLPLFFALGLALAFTPCVLPMLPLVSSLVVGRQATPRRAALLACPLPSCCRWRPPTPRWAWPPRWPARTCRRCCKTAGRRWRWAASTGCWRWACSARSRCSCPPRCASGSTRPAAASAAVRPPAQPRWACFPRCWWGRA